MDDPAPIASIDPDAAFGPEEMLARAQGAPRADFSIDDPDDERDRATMKRIIKEGEDLATRLDAIDARIKHNRRAAREALDFIRSAKDGDEALPNCTDWSKGCTRDLQIEIKSVHEDQRRITGIATTSINDRTGDQIDPLGCVFEPEVPLLLHHSAREIVGIARLGAPSKDGVPFEASIAKIVDPGTLKQRCDEAWESCKSRLLRSVSIGFQPIKWEGLPDRSGTLYREIEILELSLVAVPANPDAQILTVKAAAEMKKDELPEPTTIEARSGRLLTPINRFLSHDVNLAMQDDIERALDKCAREIKGLTEAEARTEVMTTAIEMISRKAFHAGMLVMRAHVDKELSRALKLDARLADFEEGKGYASKLESVERRLSRHAENLRRLNDWKAANK